MWTMRAAGTAARSRRCAGRVFWRSYLENGSGRVLTRHTGRFDANRRPDTDTRTGRGMRHPCGSPRKSARVHMYPNFSAAYFLALARVLNKTGNKFSCSKCSLTPSSLFSECHRRAQARCLTTGWSRRRGRCATFPVGFMVGAAHPERCASSSATMCICFSHCKLSAPVILALSGNPMNRHFMFW
jgi:hypothetical protein